MTRTLLILALVALLALSSCSYAKVPPEPDTSVMIERLAALASARGISLLEFSRFAIELAKIPGEIVAVDDVKGTFVVDVGFPVILTGVFGIAAAVYDKPLLTVRTLH